MPLYIDVEAHACLNAAVAAQTHAKVNMGLSTRLHLNGVAWPCNRA